MGILRYASVLSMEGSTLNLDRKWLVKRAIGSGGFGRVYEVESQGERAAAKFVPMAPGAERELLFVDLGTVPNVVPVLDSGEFEGYWVLVMPLADKSLRAHMEECGGEMPASEVMTVIMDLCTALAALQGNVVHRDIKPENVLLLGNTWCLADFGISRYAEATTAPDTHKFAMSPPYAAPERWRGRAGDTGDRCLRHRSHGLRDDLRP